MGTISNRNWSEILTAIRGEHPELFRPWFNNLDPTDMQHGVINVRPATPTQHQYLSQECQVAFREAAQQVTGRLVTVNFVRPATETEREQPLSFETEQLVLGNNYIFENFVTGPCNRLAHAACSAVAQRPGHVYNPLFIYGNVGLGKTHLLQAACHEIKNNLENAKILYISCETFTNHFIEAIERGALHQFRFRYRYVDALVIDDIQFLAGREHTREEFFHTFNTLFQSQKQIILSADESPDRIPGLEERLISRFNWGLVARIDSPCLETRVAILHKKAKLRCMDLPEEVAHYVAASAASNTRELEGALTKIVAMSQQFGGIIDLELAKQAIGDLIPPHARPITITQILEVVTAAFSVRAADLQGKRRNRSIAYPRQICMFLARELTPMSLEEIGGYFGGRDHTTVLHAARTIQEQRTGDGELEPLLQDLIGKLRQGTA